MNVTGRTRVFALLGDPVAHSVSPRMQNAAFLVLGLDAVYVPLRCSAGEAPGLLRAVCAAGGGGNVTIPHKAVAAGTVDRMDGPLPEACNTFWCEDGMVAGTNTDVVGIGHALDQLGAPATEWLILGTGGSCRAALALARSRRARVAIRSRSTDRAARLLAEWEAAGLARAHEPDCQVLINATPLGLHSGDMLPITPFETPAVRWVLDLVYRPGETPLVQCYRERGATATDGREVLVGQGAASLERWFPGRTAPVEVMRAAVRAALG